MKKFINQVIILCCFFSTASIAALPTLSQLESQLTHAKTLANNQENINYIEQSIKLLKQIETTQQQTAELEVLIQSTHDEINKTKLSIQKLKTQQNETFSFENLSLTQLHTELNKNQNALQNAQNELATINSKIVSQRAAPETVQKELNNNLLKLQTIEKKLFDNSISPFLKTQLELESSLIKKQNNHNQILLQGDNDLSALYSSSLEEKRLNLKLLQTKQELLQQAYNQKKLQETQHQAELLKQSQQNEKDISSFVIQQQQENLRISQSLISHTAKLNELSQDNLRIKSVLNNLQQTQRNINEQISALQGTLVLSRIINKQKHLLPQDQLINGLSKQISDLRVQIFDITELRDNLYDSEQYLHQLIKTKDIVLTDNDKEQLKNIIQERYNLLSDKVDLLNNQLNLSINLELNQKQVLLISDSLQNKLQQQSFWVKSNNPINWSWIKQFIPNLMTEFIALKEAFSFSHWQKHLSISLILSVILMLISALILWQKKNIQNRLKYINSCVNTLKKDHQRYTPEALLLTFLLTIPEAAIVMATLLISTTFLFENPKPIWLWATQMAFYWLWFYWALKILQPENSSIATRHFGFSKHNLIFFNDVTKRFMAVSYLWLNASIFSYLDTGVSGDVLGQVITIGTLIFSLFYLAPKIQRAMNLYREEKHADNSTLNILFKGVGILSYLAPTTLIILVLIGYYYTALNLMQHIIMSYFVFGLWAILKEITYRGMVVFSRQLSLQRLMEKKQQKENSELEGDDGGLYLQHAEENELDVSQIKDQVLSVVDLALFISLLIGLYWVWSDLVTVAYYLKNITLWQMNIETASGTVLQNISLWNLMTAGIISFITYALIKNLPGMLEVVIFSRFQFSQGTPYTITTLSTYAIIALGTALAFSNLGIAWADLQWLVAALSVGLGFGLQEIFANFVSGIIILFERPVRVGDVITIGDYSGTVSKIRIRSTTLIAFDNKELIVPNKAFVTERIENWALSDSTTRITISVGVAYGSDLQLVKKLLIQIASECPYVLKTPEPLVYFLNFGASTLDHELRVYVGDIVHRNPTIDYINQRIHSVFADNHIEIAFNQLDVFIKNTNSEQEIQVAHKNYNSEKTSAPTIETNLHNTEEA